MDITKFHVGQTLTLITFGGLAQTTKVEVAITSLLEKPEDLLRYRSGPLESRRIGLMKIRGKRKELYLDIRDDALVFDGWDLPIKIDSEVPSARGGVSFCFSGNACYNLAGDADLIKDYVENRNLNGPTHDQVKAKVILVGVGPDGCRDDCLDRLLYPEIETGHAVVNRMKEWAASREKEAVSI